MKAIALILAFLLSTAALAQTVEEVRNIEKAAKSLPQRKNGSYVGGNKYRAQLVDMWGKTSDPAVLKAIQDAIRGIPPESSDEIPPTPAR